MAKKTSKNPSKPTQAASKKKPAPKPAAKRVAARPAPAKRATAKPTKKASSPSSISKVHAKEKSKPVSSSKLFATLIGIDAYPDNELFGCIRDVLDVDLLLRELTAQQQDRTYEPLYLLAPNSTDKKLIQDYEAKKAVKVKSLSPTFETVTSKAFAHLKQAKAGDVCVLYYSGHGSHTQAPEIFWDTKPDRQNETLVCVDSRTDKSRDIIDKEIAYLLWDALDGKTDVHCVVITDCCHSGGMTRAVREDDHIRVRQLQPSRNDIPLEKYIGFKTSYYKVKNKRANIAIARYVHMAACRDNELAQENLSGGLYTRKLIEMLRSGGGAKSYQDLSSSLAITVQGKAGRQNPISFARELQDLNLHFLGGKLKPYSPSFEIKRDTATGKWVLYGGQMHGINADNTLINIAGTKDVVKVASVGNVRSILDSQGTAQLKSDQSYAGIIASMGNKSISVGLTKNLAKVRVDELRKAYTEGSFAYLKLIVDAKDEFDFIIDLTEDNEYSLLKRGASTPVIMPEKEADSSSVRLIVWANGFRRWSWPTTRQTSMQVTLSLSPNASRGK